MNMTIFIKSPFYALYVPVFSIYSLKREFESINVN